MARRAEPLSRLLVADHCSSSGSITRRRRSPATGCGRRSWTWQEEFDRHVEEGKRAIWIWAPIITKRCPERENSPSYREESDCEFDETPPEEWSKGLVGFEPASVFNVFQTDGEPLLELDTEAIGDGDFVSALLEAADALDLDVKVVTDEDWSHGEAKGVCESSRPMSMRPLVEAKARSNDADLATTLIHEYAHARLRFDVDARHPRGAQPAADLKMPMSSPVDGELASLIQESASYVTEAELAV